jgi:uncharacterized protein (DUF4415 family)
MLKDKLMKNEYDFSKGVRGRFYRPNKVQKTLRLDEDIIEYYKRIAQEKHVGYQTLINSALRDSIEHPEGMVDTKTLRKELRSVVKSVLKETKAA